ncbi:hypothetical protein [Sinomonas notoginsengisoli]|uniref:hypothetical protein n=1 Tax=Sinomonas notoginsengisoli TaxID=1457311 RepID=UPI001F217482|nr:hypothetical protein [Sinomonas notoginsengisoli]
MPFTPPGLALAMRLAGSGIPDGLAAVLAEVCAVPPEKRGGEAAACVLDQAGALRVVEWLEGQLGEDVQIRDAVVAMLGGCAVLFGAEEAGRLVLRHVPAAVDALEEMAQESEDAAGEDPLLSVEARAEPLMLQAALERAAPTDPLYDRELYMDESVVLPGFLLVPRRGAESVELNGALVSTPGGFVFVLSDSLLSGATAGLVPKGELEQGALAFRLDEILEALFLVPEVIDEFETAPEVGFGPSPDGELHAHFGVRNHAVITVCLAYSQWPASRREALLERFETMIKRVAAALR